MEHVFVCGHENKNKAWLWHSTENVLCDRLYISVVLITLCLQDYLLEWVDQSNFPFFSSCSYSNTILGLLFISADSIRHEGAAAPSRHLTQFLLCTDCCSKRGTSTPRWCRVQQALHTKQVPCLLAESYFYFWSRAVIVQVWLESVKSFVLNLFFFFFLGFIPTGSLVVSSPSSKYSKYSFPLSPTAPLGSLPSPPTCSFCATTHCQWSWWKHYNLISLLLHTRWVTVTKKSLNLNCVIGDLSLLWGFLEPNNKFRLLSQL